LISRRAAEKQLFLTGLVEADATPTQLATPLRDPRATAGMPATPPVTASSAVNDDVLAIDFVAPPFPAEAPELQTQDPAGGDDAPPAAPSVLVAPPELEPTVDEAPAPVEPVAAAPPAAAAATVLSMRLYSPYAGHAAGALPLAQPAAVGSGLSAAGSSEAGGLFVLTPPPEHAPEPAPAPEAVVADTAPADEQGGLFDGWDGHVGASRVVRHEEVEPPAAKSAFDWNETVTFAVMGGVGLTAFAGAGVGFHAALERSTDGGFNETTAISWGLALLGAVCLGVAGYNLVRKLGGSDD
ncbi:MAG TPA: hypothetical protein VGB49_08730, partial [Caulobacteraceae bacterium]